MFALSAANRYRWRVVDRPSPPPSPINSLEHRGMQEIKEISVLRHSSSSCLSSNLFSPPSLPAASYQESIESDGDQDHLLNKFLDQHIITSPIIEDMTPLDIFPRDIETPIPEDPLTPTPHRDPPMGVVGEDFENHEFFPMGYRAETVYEHGWIDIACGANISINIDYCGCHHDPTPGVDTPLLPNSLNVDIDAAPILIRAFGCLARDLLCLKENYPGEYIKMTPFDSSDPSSPPTADEVVNTPLSKAPNSAPYSRPHEPAERTIDIFICFKLRNVTAEFPVNVCKDSPQNFPMPSLCTDVLRIQVDYVAMDTVVYLHVDPISVHVPSVETVCAPLAATSPCRLGHVVINSIDFNCHGFTEFMCQERVEYAWMMQLLIGRITGAASPLQLMRALDWLFTAYVSVAAAGDALAVAPDGEVIAPRVEPISEEIKYRLFQLDICEVDVHVCEGESITRLQCAGFDLDMCTLHESEKTLGLSWQLHSLTGTGLLPNPQNPSVLLEVGLCDVGSVNGGVMLQELMDCVPERQMHFLHKADRRSRRLWFLWEGGPNTCGCCGGCLFQSGSIARRPQCVPGESAVYGPQFTPLPAIPRHMGMQDLPAALLDSSMEQIECVWILHHNLMDHYNLRYAGYRNTNSAHISVSDHDAHFSRHSDSEMFHSARSSLTSGMENFSLKDIDVDMEMEVKRTRHKKKPSNLSTDIRASELEGVDGVQAMQEDYVDLLPSHLLHSTTFQITPPLSRNFGPLAAATPTFSTQFTPRTPQHLQSQDFHLYLPCLSMYAPGSVPMPVHKSSLHTHTLERRQHTYKDRRVEQGRQGNQSPNFSVSVNIDGANMLRLSPPFLNIIER